MDIQRCWGEESPPCFVASKVLCWFSCKILCSLFPVLSDILQRQIQSTYCPEHEKKAPCVSCFLTFFFSSKVKFSVQDLASTITTSYSQTVDSK